MKVAGTWALAIPLAGCAGMPAGGTSPEVAVMRAAAAAPRGVSGTYVMTVRATGRQDNHLYLNSKNDYRDQRDLTIDVPPGVEDELAARLHASVPEALTGKRIAVRGVARRIRIGFMANGMMTGKYYYQTHVTLGAANQLSVR